MKFLSYNLRNALIREERKTDVWNNWRHRREVMLDVIRISDPDVLALQEEVSGSGAFWISGDGKTASKPEGSICMRHATYARCTSGATCC